MLVLRRVLTSVLVAYWVFALGMTHIPHPPPLGPVTSDKLAHFLAYGLLTGLLFLALWNWRPGWRYLPLIVLGIVVAYAAFDELTQPIFGRDCEFLDWVADSSAAVVAVSVLGAVRLRIKRENATGDAVR